MILTGLEHPLATGILTQPHTSPSSRGLGHRPFTAVTRVRIPLGARSTCFTSTTGVEQSRPGSAVG